MKVGKANYGGKKEVFKIKDGSNPYRILPPLGKLADIGKYSVYYRIEWGYKGSDNKQKPFQCPRVVNRDTKMVEVESAAYLHRLQLEKDKESAVAAFKFNPSDPTLKAAVQQATDDVKQYNSEAKHYFNAVGLDGKIGLLKLGHKAVLSFRTQLDLLKKEGKDPLAIENGIFFDFHRSCPTNNFRDTITQVSTYKEKVQGTVNGQNVELEQVKTHTMDAAFCSRLGSEAFELSDLYPEPTAAEVEQIVNEGALAVDRILAKKDKEPAPADNTQTAANTAVEQRAEAVAETPETSVSENVVTPETTPLATTTVETPASSADPAEVSTEDFLKEIGAI
jgi:hypothetical protein